MLLVTALLLLVTSGYAQLYGAGCVGFEVLPPPGAVLGASPNWTFNVSFSVDVGIMSPVDGLVAVAYWNNETLSNLASSAKMLLLSSQDGVVTVAPSNYQPLGNRSLLVTFPSAQLASESTIYLKIGFAFLSMTAPSLGLPAQGWMEYGVQSTSFVPHFAPPSPLGCPLPSPIANNYAPHAMAILHCNVPADCTIQVQASLPEISNHTIPVPLVLVSPDGDLYHLSHVPLVAATYTPSTTNYSLGSPYAITPVYEAMNELNSLPLPIWKDTTSAVAQEVLNTYYPGSDVTLTFPLEGNRPFNPSDDTTDVPTFEAAFPMAHKVMQLKTPDGRSTFLSWDRTFPRTVYSWFIRWDWAEAGVHCPSTSSRNADCPTCPSISHYWASVWSDPWSVFQALSSLPSGGGTTLWLNSTPCGSIPDCDIHINSPSDTSSAYRLITRDIRATVPQLQDTTEWLWVPESIFAGGGCNTPDVDMRDFVQEANFCSQNVSSCLGNQLDSLWSRPQLRAVRAIGSSLDLSLAPQSHLLATRTNFSAGTTLNASFSLSSFGISILQPQLQVSTAWSVDPIYDSLSRLVRLSLTNIGSLGALVSLNISCDNAEVTTEAVLLPPSSTKSALVSLLLSPRPGMSLSCSGQLYVPKLPYWSPVVSSDELPALHFDLEPNGCWSTLEPSTLFVNASSWVGADPTHIFSEGGLLGPNPTNLNVSFLADSASRSFFASAQFSATMMGSRASSPLSISVSCYSELGNFEMLAQNSTLYRGQTTPLEYTWTLLGGQNPSIWNCSLHLTLEADPCAQALGRQVAQPFTIVLPASPCFSAGVAEPSLFQSTQVGTPSTELKRDLMTFHLKQAWTPIPWSTQDWSRLGLQAPPPGYPRFSYISVVTSSVKNAGDAQGNITVSANCFGGATFYDPYPSTVVCSLNPGETCSIQLAFGSNTSSPVVSGCAVVVQIVVPDAVCWTPNGKTYLQQMDLSAVQKSGGVSVPSKARKSSWNGGTIALVVILVLLVLALLAVIVSFFVYKHLQKSHSQAKMEQDIDYNPPTAAVPPPQPDDPWLHYAV